MKKVIIELFLLMVLAVVSSIIIYDKFGNTEKVIITDDENIFKNSYEQYNMDKKYIPVRIMDDNNVEYIDIEKFEELLKSDSAVIFIGTGENNMSRNIVETLLNSLNGAKFYYYDVNENFIEKEIDGKNVFVIDDNISDYKKMTTIIKDTNIVIPTVIFVKNGNIIGIHSGIIESVKDFNKSLTKDQKKELVEIYTKYIDKIK